MRFKGGTAGLVAEGPALFTADEAKSLFMASCFDGRQMAIPFYSVSSGSASDLSTNQDLSCQETITSGFSKECIEEMFFYVACAVLQELFAG